MKAAWSVLLYILIITGMLSAQTVVTEGPVYGTWTADKDPYLINGDITIPDDSTLTIEAGVLVEFQKHAGLWVQGRLLALGTEADSIIFTVADTSGFSLPDTSGGWYGIRFVDTPLENDSSRLAYCRLEYGKAVGEVWHLNGGGAILAVNFGKISVDHCLFAHNFAGGPEKESPSGGAIHLVNADIILTGSVFLQNRAVFNGGAIYCFNSDPTIRQTSFVHNKARYGAAILTLEQSRLTMLDCVFGNNQAADHGGALNIGYHAEADLQEVKFQYNSADHGGAIMGGFAELMLRDCTFEYNQVSGLGAGLSLDSCRVQLDQCTFYNNTAGEWGGGMHLFNCVLDLTDCLFLENTGLGLGGGIHSDFSTVTGRKVTFIGNHSDLSGGLHSWYTQLQLSDCRFERNSAVSSGAGIHADYSRVTLDSTTFYDNQADWGAALQVYNSDLRIGSCLFNKNSALNGNGGAVHYHADSTIFDQIYRVEIEATQFIENTATLLSGGVHIEQVNSDTSLAGVSIDHCVFRRNHAARFCPLRISGSLRNIILANSVFHNNTSTQWVAGPALVSGASGTMYNCISMFNYASFHDSTASSSNATLNNNAAASFINCTFADSSHYAGYGLSVGNGSQATLINTIIWGCGTQPVYPYSNTDTGSEVSLYYCDVEYGTDSVYTTDSLSAIYWGKGNLASDPQFTGLTKSDLHLANESPLIGSGIACLDIGDTRYCAPPADIEGTMRPSPSGSNPDIGAYENILGFPAAIAGNSVMMPKSDQLNQNFPNPFNPVTNISYQLSTGCHVRVSIYNLLGQELTTLINEHQAAGSYTLAWDGSQFASGIYLCRMITDKNFSETRKLVLLR